MRGTTNRNVRGSSADRAARRAYLLRTYECIYGKGMCLCWRCGKLLREGTLTVDRIIPGCRGGKYTRNNIRPACSGCNSETGGRVRRAA